MSFAGSSDQDIDRKENQQPQWQLLYCKQWFLRNKQVEKYRFQVFEDTLAVVGAELIYCRKPQQLEGFGEYATTPYVLFTTFHEVKPCMDILARQNPQARPLFTVVICDVKQHGRASRWAAAQSALIYVFDDRHCPSTLTQGIAVLVNHFLGKNSMPSSSSPNEHAEDGASSSTQRHEESGAENSIVERVMQEWVGTGASPVQVEQMLLAALPELYDE